MKLNDDIQKMPGYFSNIPVTYYMGSIAYDGDTGSFNDGVFYFKENEFQKYEDYLFLDRNHAISVLATSLESACQQLSIDFSEPLNQIDQSFLLIKLDNHQTWKDITKSSWKNKVEKIYKLVFQV